MSKVQTQMAILISHNEEDVNRLNRELETGKTVTCFIEEHNDGCYASHSKSIVILSLI
jgi:hypothetical protein